MGGRPAALCFGGEKKSLHDASAVESFYLIRHDDGLQVFHPVTHTKVGGLVSGHIYFTVSVHQCTIGVQLNE